MGGVPVSYFLIYLKKERCSPHICTGANALENPGADRKHWLEGQ